MLIKMSHVMLFALDHASLVKWYCDKLGYQIVYNAPGEYASLSHKVLGRLSIHATDSKADIGHGAMPWFLCEDMEKTVADLRAKGIKVKDPRREGESAMLSEMHDCEGNYWGIEEA